MPDGGNQLTRRTTKEPGVGLAVGRTGLAERDAVGVGELCVRVSGPVLDDAPQHVHLAVGCIGADCLRPEVRRRFVEHQPAARISDALDEVRIVVNTAVRDRRRNRCHFQWRGTDRSERQRQIRLELVRRTPSCRIDAHLVRRVDHLVETDRELDAGERAVDRFLGHLANRSAATTFRVARFAEFSERAR